MDAYYELVITMTETDASQEAFNFNLYNVAELMESEAGIRDGYVKMGIDVTGFSTYQSATAKFIVIDATAQTPEGESMCRRQIYTVYNGQAIHFTLNSYTSELTPELEAELQSVVDSVVFTQTFPTPEDTLASQSTGFGDSIMDHASTGFMVGGIIAFVIAIFFALKKGLTMKNTKKKSEITSNDSNDK